MPVIAGRSREQLRISVGYALGAIYVSSATSQGTTTTLVDSTLLGGDNDYIGWWVVFTSGTNDGTVVRVTDSTGSSGTLTIPTVTQTEDNDTYELWEPSYPPAAIHDFLDQALIDATGHAYDPIENITLHADGKTARFDIPTGISMLTRVQYRKTVTRASVHLMERTFDETTDSDFTQALDTEDFRRGNSLKLTIGSGVSAGDFITGSLTALDLSRYTHLEGWTKAATTLAANDFVFRLDSGVVQGDATDLEILNIPATIAADTWTFHRIALANPETDTAIVSVGIEYNANQAANTVWFDEWEAVVNDSAVWVDLPRHLWHIDKEARDLIFDAGVVSLAGYSLLKLVGGDKPALLSSDSSTTEVDDTYLISTATMLALVSAQGGGTHNTPEQRDRLLAYWTGKAERAKNAFPFLVNVRGIS